MAIRYTSFPQTTPPDDFIYMVVDVFERHKQIIERASNEKGFGSDNVLAEIRNSLLDIGFQVEKGKRLAGRIDRPVFFGENGVPSLQYQVDAFHPDQKAGLEVEAGRGIMGGALYRDLIQAMVMVNVDHLFVSLLNTYKFSKSVTKDYDKGVSVARALYSHDRVTVPFKLTLIGYGPLP